MRPSQALAALGAFASLSMGSPTEEEGLGYYTLYQEPSSNTTEWSHPSIMMHQTYLKYGFTPPKDVELAADAARKGSVKNFPGKFDNFYLVPTKIGNPPQTLMLDFDTGSSDLWVYSSLSPAGIRKGHKIYNPSKSSTAKRVPGDTWAIRYGDGSSAGGIVYHDTVRLGPVPIKSQGVEIAKRAKGTFSRSKNIDGLFGSGFTNGNTARPTPQKVWWSHANLASKLFCARLNHGAPGAYDIGFINPKHHSGPVHYTPVSSANSYWQFKTAGYRVGGGAHHPTSFNAIADTGTSVAYVPLSALRQYFKGIPSAQYNSQVGGIIYKCSSKLKSFSITIGGSSRTIPASYINAGFVGTSGGARYCFSGLQSNQGMRGLSILGDTFLKSQYVVFDFGASRIGFADK